MSSKTEQNGPIRVLLVGPDLPIVGGQTVQARLLVEKFQNDAEVQLDLQAINPRFLPRLQSVKYLRTAVTTIKYLYDLLTRIPRYDVIHIFSASYFSFVLAPTPAVAISRLFRKRTVLNYRSGEADDHFTRWKTAISTVKLFDRVIAPSGYLVDVFKKHDVTAHTIFNVVDTGKFRFRSRSPLRPVFLSNRNLEPLYNVGCVIRAFAKIQKAIPYARLMIVGDGSQRGTLEKLVKELGLTEVHFLGSVPPSEMPGIYDQADIYLNTPNLDNMPNSIIEAFASGLPVVSTNAGGIPYIVQHERNGLLVEVGDHEGLALEAIRLLDDPKIAEGLIEHAFADCANYSWESVRSQWVELYQELVEARGSLSVAAPESNLTASVEN